MARLPHVDKWRVRLNGHEVRRMHSRASAEAYASSLALTRLWDRQAADIVVCGPSGVVWSWPDPTSPDLSMQARHGGG